MWMTIVLFALCIGESYVAVEDFKRHDYKWGCWNLMFASGAFITALFSMVI